MSPTCRVHIRKEAYKFSSAHMTVFADGTKERLHGHNYQVEVEVELPRADVSQMVEFRAIKDVVKSLCQAWDEHVLLPRLCPFLTIVQETATELEFRLCGVRYVLPRDEVIQLNTDNITSESLAELFCGELVAQFNGSATRILSAVVRIDETPGQGASYEWTRAHPRSEV